MSEDIVSKENAIRELQRIEKLIQDRRFLNPPSWPDVTGIP